MISKFQNGVVIESVTVNGSIECGKIVKTFNDDTQMEFMSWLLYRIFDESVYDFFTCRFSVDGKEYVYDSFEDDIIEGKTEDSLLIIDKMMDALSDIVSVNINIERED